jgi:type II secretory pathway pseudopilin PulG
MRLREQNPARSTNRSNALLVELLIVVMFFMLSATVLLQVFAAARNQSRQAERMIGALNTAQNVADELYAAEDAGGRLKELGFEEGADGWVLRGEEADFRVTFGEKDGAEDRIQHVQVQALLDGEAVLTLPVARIREVRP